MHKNRLTKIQFGFPKFTGKKKKTYKQDEEAQKPFPVKAKELT